VVAVTSTFTAAALIGTALALEAQAIASPAARLRRQSVLRMNTSPEVPIAITKAERNKLVKVDGNLLHQAEVQRDRRGLTSRLLAQISAGLE
jgi:hypothetical protein